MNNLENLLSKLEKVKKNKKQFVARCPSHSDKTASLAISEQNGKILLKCFAGCDTKNILSEVGLQFRDLFLEDSDREYMTSATKIVQKTKGKKYNSIEEIIKNYQNVEDVYEYSNLGQETSVIQIRFLTEDGKKFNTYHKDGDEWYVGKPEGLTPLYNLNNVKSSKYVLIVEGEKVVNILNELNIPAVCSLGGANNAENTDWTPLRDKSSIAIWRDNDDPGIIYQQTICSIMHRLGLDLRKVEVEKLGLEKGDDLEQFIDRQTGSDEDIKKAIFTCIPKLEVPKPVNFLKDHLIKVKSGEIKNLDVTFFPLLTKTVRMFKPGSQSVIVSAGGVGKSLFLGRTSDEWVLNKQARVARLMLESPMSFHLLRSLSQQARRTDILSEEFHYDNPKESDQIVQEYEDVLNQIGETITTTDIGSKKQIGDWSADAIAKWMEINAPNNDVLIIDPVSIALGDSPWLTSTMLTKKAEELMSAHKHLCIIWVQHTSEQTGSNVGGISGGKAWNRYSSAILEMIMLEEPELYEIMNYQGDIIQKEVKIFFKVKKCRNGSANGHKIAVDLDTTDLSYKEVGRMLKKVKL